MEQATGRMATPTLSVSAEDFDMLKYAETPQYVIHGRRGLKVVPKTAQEIGENVVMFPTGPKQIIFRKRWTRKTVTRDVRYITADNSDRYDIRFTIYLR